MLKHRFVPLVIGGLFLLVLASCGGGERQSAAVTISPTHALLAPGEAREFTAVVSGTDDTSVTWQASAGELDVSGSAALYTAPEVAGEYTLTATSTADAKASATASVTVDAADTEIHENISHDGGEIVTADDTILRIGEGVLSEATEVRVRTFSGATDDYPDGIAPVGPKREFLFVSSAFPNQPTSGLLSDRLATEDLDDPFANRILVRVPFPEHLASNRPYLVDVTIDAGGEPFNYPEVYYPGGDRVIEISAGLLSALQREGDAPGELSITIQLVKVEASLAPAANIPHKGLFAITDEFIGGAWASLPKACPGNAKESLPPGVVKARDEHLDNRTPLVLITGWQTLQNLKTGWKTMPWNMAYVPQVCGWQELLASLSLENDRLYDDVGELQRRYAIFTYGYDSDLSIADNGLALKNELAEYFGDRKIVILAHSMGGLLTNYAVNAAALDNVSHAITLGTPYRGTTLIHCVKTSGQNCSEVKVNPRIKEELDETCKNEDIASIGLCMVGTRLVQNIVAWMASRQGDRDLAWQYGGAHNYWVYPMCEGEFRLCAISIETVPNPRLDQLNFGLKRNDVSQFTAFVGDISPTHDSALFGTIAALLLLADGQHSDGITPVASGCLSTSKVDNSCNNGLIPNTTTRALTHTELSGSLNYNAIRELLLASTPDQGPPAAFSLQPPETYCTTTHQPAIRLHWSASTGAEAYEIYRDDVLYLELETLATTFENTANVTPGVAYTYFVRARNAHGRTDTQTQSVALPANMCKGQLTSILYYADSFLGTDYLDLSLAMLPYDVTYASSWPDFDEELASSEYDLAIALVQNSYEYPDVEGMTDHVNRGGRVIYTDWTADPRFEELLEFHFTGSSNMTLMELHPPLGEGVTTPTSLINPGWDYYSLGLTPAVGGESRCTFPQTDDSCLVVGNDGQTIVLGFLADVPMAEAGEQLFSNIIEFFNIPFVPVQAQVQGLHPSVKGTDRMIRPPEDRGCLTNRNCP